MNKYDLDFSDCKSKRDVKRELKKQAELEIPTGVSRKVRTFFMKVRDFVIDYQIFGNDEEVVMCGKCDWDVHCTDCVIVKKPWSKFDLRYSTIGGCDMFHANREFDIAYDGGLGHALFSYYADYPLEDGELLERLARESGLRFEAHNNWSGGLYED